MYNSVNVQFNLTYTIPRALKKRIPVEFISCVCSINKFRRADLLRNPVQMKTTTNDRFIGSASLNLLIDVQGIV